MPEMKSRLKALKKQYGDKEGAAIFSKMEKEGKNVRVRVKAKKKKFKRFKK